MGAMFFGSLLKPWYWRLKLLS